MRKDTNFTGQPVFNQLLKLLTRHSVERLSHKTPGSEDFAQVYALLLKQYAPFLADSRTTKEQKEWEKLLYMMDSTTISLFDNILKGVVLIANLLLTVMQQKIKRHCSFSQIVTMVRQTLMYYIDFVAFMENPNRSWQIISDAYEKSPPKIVQYSLLFE